MMSVDAINQIEFPTCQHCGFTWNAVIETTMIRWGNTWPDSICLVDVVECPNCGCQTMINNENMG